MRYLRQAEWLTRNRAQAYCHVLAVVTCAVSVAWIGVAFFHGGIDFSGHPVAPDFAPYWTAAKLALSDHPNAAYDPEIQYGHERALFGGASLGGPTPFVYPPLFLLLCLPFAMLPYTAAVAAWLGLTAASFWYSIPAIWPRQGLALPVLVYPGLLINLLNGQNGLLSASLFATATVQLDRRPVVAGALFGCLAYKPQLGIVIPFALLLCRDWTAILSGAVTAALFAAASLVIFDPAIWVAFLSAARSARVVLEHGLAGPPRMVSVFAAAQLWRAPVAVAYMAQLACGIAVVAALAMAPRRLPSLARGATICAAVPLVSPYLFDYDLAILAVPIAWVAREAETDGRFLPWEKLVLLAGFVLPLFARPVATYLAVPLGPLIAASLFCVVLRRIQASRLA